jgi:hypothetical protein
MMDNRVQLIVRYQSHNPLNPTDISNNRIKYPNTR